MTHEKRMARFIDGYDSVPRWLARDMDEVIHLRTAVTAVEWSRGSVRISVAPARGRRTRSYTARAVIVAVPLGVLQTPPPAPGAITIDPDLPRFREALGTLASGG